jgi:hypothetical protein
MRLEFAEGWLDRIEIWRIGRQVKQARACRIDRFFVSRNLVDAGIVYDNDVAALESRGNAFLDLGNEHRAVHGAIKYERRYHCPLPQASDERDNFPVSFRCIADQPLSARTATA